MKNDFRLIKITAPKEGGLDCHYRVSDEKEETHKSNYNNPHKDLITALNKLKPYLVILCNYTFISSICYSKEFGATEEQLKLLEEKTKDFYKKVLVTGITIHREDKRMLTISGRNLGEYNQFQALQSPKLFMNGSKYGFEAKVSKIVKEIEKEAYLFYYENKTELNNLF